jgi:heme oxygenase
LITQSSFSLVANNEPRKLPAVSRFALWNYAGFRSGVRATSPQNAAECAAFHTHGHGYLGAPPVVCHWYKMHAIVTVTVMGGLLLASTLAGEVRNPGAMAGLRAATWSAHQRLEKRLDVKGRFCDPDRYREHLVKMWGFCGPLEAGLGPEAFGGALPDYEARRKLPLIAQDLTALGMPRAAVAELPRCTQLPRCDRQAMAWGRAYVFEGATLGGRMLLPLVEEHLGWNAQHGASFLASYGANVMPMWATFAAALEAACATPDERAAAAAAATVTFEALEQWLCGDRR